MLWVIVTNPERDTKRAGTWIVRAESIEGAIDRFLSLEDRDESTRMGIVGQVFLMILYVPEGERLECYEIVQALTNNSFSEENEKAKQDLLTREKEKIADFLISVSDQYFLCNAETVL